MRVHVSTSLALVEAATSSEKWLLAHKTDLRQYTFNWTSRMNTRYTFWHSASDDNSAIKKQLQQGQL